MSEKNAFQQSPQLAALVEDLRLHRVDRRAFLMKAAASGMTMAAASALATDALAEASSPEVFGRVPGGVKWQASTPTKQAQVEIRIPSTIRVPKRDLERLTAEFNTKLIELIRRNAGGDLRARYTGVAKTQEQTVTSTVLKTVEVGG